MTLDPGIAKTVAWLNANGFHTTDSGDGKTKFTAEGDPKMECALPKPHVVIRTGGLTLAQEGCRLATLLRARGVVVQPQGLGGAEIHCTYDPADNTALIMLIGADDASLFLVDSPPAG